MNDQDHSLSLSDPDRSLVLSHFLTNFLQNLASCHTAFNHFKNLTMLRTQVCLSQLRPNSGPPRGQKAPACEFIIWRPLAKEEIKGGAGVLHNRKFFKPRPKL
jgi:hypothetical protein